MQIHFRSYGSSSSNLGTSLSQLHPNGSMLIDSTTLRDIIMVPLTSKTLTSFLAMHANSMHLFSMFYRLVCRFCSNFPGTSPCSLYKHIPFPINLMLELSLIVQTEADSMDPQHRMLMEVCYEAAESAGVTLSDLSGSDTAVFIGLMSYDYSGIASRDPNFIPTYLSSGTANSNAAARIS